MYIVKCSYTMDNKVNYTHSEHGSITNAVVRLKALANHLEYNRAKDITINIVYENQGINK